MAVAGAILVQKGEYELRRLETERHYQAKLLDPIVIASRMVLIQNAACRFALDILRSLKVVSIHSRIAIVRMDSECILEMTG